MAVKKKPVIITSAVAAFAVAAAVAGTFLLGATGAAAEFDGDFTNRSYGDAWDGTYTFEWYSKNPDASSFEIGTASDLAGLAVLTNDLSGAEFSAIQSAVGNSEYIEKVETFKGKTIKLTADIDLNGKDWMPISYPWYTANVTHENYDALSEIKDKEITPVDSWYGGEKISTRYLDLPESEMRFRDLLYGINFDDEINQRTDVKAGTVIKPEYEDDKTLFDKYTVGKDITGSQSFGSYPDNGDPGFVCDFALISNVHGRPENGYDATDFNRFYGLRDLWGTQAATYPTNESTFVADAYPVSKLGNAVKPMSSLKTLDMSTMLSSYEYKSIKGSTDNEGFKGTFDGGNHCVKGLHPSTPWTDDDEERLNTYDPLGKGLFGYLAEEGTVKNVNVQGKYDDDVVSYSAILCAYNYGTISDCWVDGDMKQGLITMKYPTRREYKANADGTSKYELSASAGTVMPVGHSGFVTAVNYGTIDGCTTSGKVEQAFRMFGFAACTNEEGATVSNFTNYAKFSTTEVDTDFTTDEWTNMTNVSDKAGKSFTYSDLYTRCANKFGNDWANNNENKVTKGTNENASNTEALNIQGGAYYAGSVAGQTDTGAPWVMPLYKQSDLTDDYSLAANHIYGVYGFTAVGGVCAENFGTVSDSANYGEIEVMYNTSTRRLAHLYDISEDNAALQDYYSYIRPNTGAGLFATQNNTVNLAAGITPINRGTLKNVTNAPASSNPHAAAIDSIKENALGNINKRTLTARDQETVGASGHQYDTTECFRGSGAIIYAEGGHYFGHGCKYSGGFMPMSLTWWATDDVTLEKTGFIPILYGPGSVDPGTYQHDTVEIKMTENGEKLANMPYPMAYSPKSEMKQFASNITVWNTGAIDTAKANASAEAGVSYWSETLGTAPASMSNINIDYSAVTPNSSKYNLGYRLIDTNVDNADVTNSAPEYSLANYCISRKDAVTVDNILIKKGKGGFGRTLGVGDRANTADSVVINNLTNYDVTNYQTSDVVLPNGVVWHATNTSFNNVCSFQPGNTGISPDLKSCNISNVYVYGRTATAGIGCGTIDNKGMTNVNYYGACNLNTTPDHQNDKTGLGYAFGSFSAADDSNKPPLDKIHVASFEEDGTTLAESRYAANLDGLKLTNSEFILKVCDTAITADNCDIENISLVGDTDSKAVYNSSAGGYKATRPENNYWYLFSNTNLKDTILEMDLDFEFRDPIKSIENPNLQEVPGVLCGVGSGVSFENVAVQIPDGALSYNTTNRWVTPDDTNVPKEQVKLSYDKEAGKSGSLAYYMTEHAKTDSEGKPVDAPKKYTVAYKDTENIIKGITDFVNLDLVPDTYKITVNYPVYTREANDTDDYKPFRRMRVLYTGNGAGEVKATVTRTTNGEDVSYSTEVEEPKKVKKQNSNDYEIVKDDLGNTVYEVKQFPAIDVFAFAGEKIALAKNEHTGYALKKITMSWEGGFEDLESDLPPDEEYSRSSVTMPDYDVTLTSEWTGVFVIFTEENDKVQIIPGCAGTAGGQRVTVNTLVTDPGYKLGRLYYYNYLPDVNNRKIKTGEPNEINLDDMYFKMPENEVMICADVVRDNAEITEFVMDGVSGFINQNDRTIEVNLETSNSSVDLASLAPDSIKVDGVTVKGDMEVTVGEQSWKIPQNFSGNNAIKYTIKAESGREITYKVRVVAKEDGAITGFNVLGFEGDITQPTDGNGKITLTVPDKLDLTNVKPSIVWAGTKIDPSTGSAVDLTANNFTYTVTSSGGATKTYDIVVNRKEISDNDLNNDTFDITINDIAYVWKIDRTAKLIYCEVPYGTDRVNGKFKKLDLGDAAASNEWKEGDAINLTRANYITIIEGGREVSYTIRAIEKEPTTAKLNQFRLYTFDGVIDEDAKTVTVTLPAGYPTENIRPSVVNFTGKSITINGETDHAKLMDYTNGATIVVTAYDGSSSTYTLTVNIGQ